MSDQFIKLNNKFMSNHKTYSPREKFIYAVLMSLENNISGTAMFSVDLILDVLNISKHSKNRNSVKDLLIAMEEKGMIDIYNDLLRTKRIHADDIKNSGIYFAKTRSMDSDDNFTKVYHDEMKKILKMEGVTREGAFIVFYNIVSRIYDSETSPKYAYPTMGTITSETDMNRKTVMKYLQSLIANEILYCAKVNDGYSKNRNYYSRWSEKEYLISALNELSNNGLLNK